MKKSTTNKDWKKFQDEIKQWESETFPKSTLHSRMEHLRDETFEVEDNPKDIYEWADVLMLYFQGLTEQGYTLDDVYDACIKKFEILKNREWDKPDEKGVVRHKKTNESQLTDVRNRLQKDIKELVRLAEEDANEKMGQKQ